MKFLRSLAIAAALGAGGSTFAGDLAATVTSVLQPVTWASANQPTFASYAITMTNTKPNAISGVRLIGTASVVNGTSTAQFYPASSDTHCTATNVQQTAVACSFGLLQPNAPVSFTVTFSAPTDGDQIAFAWSAVFDESGGGASDGSAGTTTTGLAPPNDAAVTSVVPQGGNVTFFTGSGSGIATPSDPWTTTVSVPTGAASTTATVAESSSNVTCAPDLLTCNITTLSIPGTFANLLVITLRRDASTIRNGAKISNARIFYDGATTPDPFVVYPLEVLSCNDTTYGLVPRAGVPCIDTRTAYPKKSTPKNPVPTGFEGDWEFIIKAVDNGQYRG